jgi:hypothetical protein
MNAFPHNSTVILVHGAWADGSCWRDVILPVETSTIKLPKQPTIQPLTSDKAVLARPVIQSPFEAYRI